MAKKSQPAALQAEVSTDEEWEKILEKDGLLGKHTKIFSLF